MSFRDNNDAWHEREKAELRDKLEASREEARKSKEALERVSKQPARVSHQPAPTKSVMPQLPLPSEIHFNEEEDAWVNKVMNNNHSWAPSYGSRFGDTFGSFWKFGLIGLVAVVGVAIAIHHEFYDIRDGYVTSKQHREGYYTTSCHTSNGHRTCSTTYHPPTWNVAVSFQGDSASWGVTESEYDQISYGDWYCSRDLLHTAPCVQNRPSME